VCSALRIAGLRKTRDRAADGVGPDFPPRGQFTDGERESRGEPVEEDTDEHQYRNGEFVFGRLYENGILAEFEAERYREHYEQRGWKAGSQ
jgi:hypothetical protein